MVAKDLMTGLRERDLRRSDWPRGTASWEKSIKTPLKVFKPGESMIRLANAKESAADQVQSILKLKRALVQVAPNRRKTTGKEKDKKKVILMFELAGQPSVALSYDVEVRNRNELVTKTSFVAFESATGGFTTGSSTETTLEELDSSVRMVDIILKPNPRHLESKSHIEVISDQRVIFPNVLLDRLDLDAGEE